MNLCTEISKQFTINFRSYTEINNLNTILIAKASVLSDLISPFNTEGEKCKNFCRFQKSLHKVEGGEGDNFCEYCK